MSGRDHHFAWRGPQCPTAPAYSASPAGHRKVLLLLGLAGCPLAAECSRARKTDERAGDVEPVKSRRKGTLSTYFLLLSSRKPCGTRQTRRPASEHFGAMRRQSTQVPGTAMGQLLPPHPSTSQRLWGDPPSTGHALSLFLQEATPVHSTLTHLPRQPSHRQQLHCRGIFRKSTKGRDYLEEISSHSQTGWLLTRPGR